MLWSKLPLEQQNEYVHFLKVFGALSGLFKDHSAGDNARKPFLHYRNHEQLYARTFDVIDLTRKDSAFDVVFADETQRVGIGLKTWIHTNDFTYQKVAEFNKDAPELIHPLIAQGNAKEVVKKVAELRNERISLDKRLYKTDQEIYHYVTRDDDYMYINEATYDYIDIENIEVTKETKTTYHFTDQQNNYRYYNSKSVLLEEFDASKDKRLVSIPIEQYEDPFLLLESLDGTKQSKETKDSPYIYLPMYADRSMKVHEKSAFNAWNAAPKSKKSKGPRPAFEAYIPIPIWVHRAIPNFFGFNPLNPKELSAAESFHLHLPSGEIIPARITQQNGKSLQTNPQSILGEWILHDVFGLNAYEQLTNEHLKALGVDSFRIEKIDDENFKIDLGPRFAFEQWKIQLQEDQPEVKIPNLRPDLLEEL